MKPVAPDDFPVKARAIVKDLFEPNPIIYWCDFSFHMILGWACFIYSLQLPAYSFFQFFTLIVAALALYRAAIFIHELSHLKRGTFKLFRLVWNLTCGIPLFVPSYWYSGVHIEHHKRNIYGTKEDGEYLAFVSLGRWAIVKYVLMHLWLPFVFVGKPLFMTPLTLFSERIKKYSWEKVSSLAIDLDYVRGPADPRDAKLFQVQDWVTSIYAMALFVLFLTGALPLKVALIWYVLSATVFVLNALRTCVAHAYRNPGELSVTLSDQFLDSVDIPGHKFWTALWAPVGLRYHATHHLFPAMPYHNLGEARRRLEKELGPDSVYSQAVRPSFLAAFAQLWKEARKQEEPANLVTA